MKKQIVVLVLAAVLVFGCAVGGTLAWLMDKTAAVVNTFTYGDINITLEETDADENGNANANSYQMIPGSTITKDPKVTVAADSEACWLFVKVDAVSCEYINYEIDDAWSSLDGVNNVYYIQVSAAATAQSFYVIKDNTVSIANTVTKTELDAISETSLTFTAYAVQQSAGTVEEAWGLAQDNANY